MRGVGLQVRAEGGQRDHLHLPPAGLLMHQHAIHLYGQDRGVVRALHLCLGPDRLALLRAGDGGLRLRLGHRAELLGQAPRRLITQRGAQRLLPLLHRRREAGLHRGACHDPQQPRRDGARTQAQRPIQRRLPLLTGRAPIVGAVQRVVAHQAHEVARALLPLQVAPAVRAAHRTRQQLCPSRGHVRDQLAQEHPTHLLGLLLQRRQVRPQHLRDDRFQRLPHQSLHLLYDGAGQVCSVHGSPPRGDWGGVNAPPPLGRVPPSAPGNFLVAHP